MSMAQKGSELKMEWLYQNAPASSALCLVNICLAHNHPPPSSTETLILARKYRSNIDRPSSAIVLLDGSTLINSLVVPNSAPSDSHSLPKHSAHMLLTKWAGLEADSKFLSKEQQSYAAGGTRVEEDDSGSSRG